MQYITSTLPNAKVVVSTIPPAGRAGSALEQKAERYDSLIRNGITGISPNVSVVDSRSAMTYSADIGPDHVHPNDAGDAVLAQTFFNGITAGTGVTVVPATTPAPTIYLTPTSGGSIIETSGVPLTMSQDGTILLGGVPLPGTLGSTEMAYYNNLIYSENFGNWYYYDGTVWHQTTTPPAGITPTGLPFTPTPGAPPPATPTAIPSATPTTPTTTPVTTMPTAISIGQNTDQLRFLASQNATDTAVTPPAAHPMATLTLADATGDSLTVPGGSGAPDRPTASLGSVCWHDVLQQFIISHS